MDSSKEVTKFKKSFLLHSSRYNLYSIETLEKGATSKHNKAISELGKLGDRVTAYPTIYSDLMLELMQNGDPKTSLCASFACLTANIHTQKALDTLLYILNNTPGISLICDFDIHGSITQFKKRQLDAIPFNEVDIIVKELNSTDDKESQTDESLINTISKLSDINMGGRNGRTFLIHACIARRQTLVKRLIDLGADVNKTDCKQKSALQCAAIVGNIEIVKLLLTNSANVNHQDVRGFTALDYAKANATKLSDNKINELVKVLISHGAKTKQEISPR